jgi:hypothetical protein
MRLGSIVLLYLLALSGGSYLAFRPTFDSDFSRMQNDPGDTLLNHYILEHTWLVISEPDYRGTLLSPSFFFPTPLVLGYSENFLGVAPLYWALRVGLPDHLSYQWWMILTNVLNFVAFALVARWFGCSHILAALGGYLWAFAVVHIYQINHQQMIPRFWFPIAVWHVWRLAEAPNPRSLNRAVASVFLQSAACIYTGWFLTAGLAVFFSLSIVLRTGKWRALIFFLKSNWRSVAVILGLWGLLFGLFFTPYFVANQGVVRTYGECADLLPPIEAWFVSPPGAKWYEPISSQFDPIAGECHLFCGFGIYLLALAAGIHICKRSKANRSRNFPLIAACLLTAGIWILLTLNIYQNASAWWLVRFIPGGQAIRCVARVYVVVYLFLVLGGLLWLQLASNRIRWTGLRNAILAVICGVIVYEQTGFQTGSFDKAKFYDHAELCAAGLRGEEAGYIVTPESGYENTQGELLGMWAGMKANVPVVNGYSGRCPPNYVQGPEDADSAMNSWLSGRYSGRVAIINPLCPNEVRYVIVE